MWGLSKMDIIVLFICVTLSLLPFLLNGKLLICPGFVTSS